MNMKRILTFVLLLFLAVTVRAQQDPTHSQYLFNKLVLNPAYAGSSGELSLRMMARWQWVGFDNAPKTQTFSFHMPTADTRHGFGVNFVADRLGHTQSLLFNVNYAYRIPLGSGHLGLGLDMGLKSLQLNHADIDLQENDPVFGSGRMSMTHFVAGPGIYYQNELFYAGASVPNIVPSNLGKLYMVPGATAKSPVSIYLMGGAAIPLGEAVKLRPSVLLRATPDLPVGLDLGLGAMFVDRILVGGIWRPGSSMVLHLQTYITPKLQLGYAYDLSLREIRNYNSGSHEIMLGLDLNVHQSNLDVPVRF